MLMSPNNDQTPHLPVRRPGLFTRIKRPFSTRSLRRTRLDCAISNYKIHLCNKLIRFQAKSHETAPLEICQEYLKEVDAAYQQANWDASWRLLKTARRQEIQTFTRAECLSQVEILQIEEEKLKEWRRIVVGELLKPLNNCPDEDLLTARVRLEQAQRINDEYFDDEHMRIGVLRRRINPLVAVFAALIVGLLLASYSGNLSAGFPDFPTLSLTVVFGLLGACASVASDLVTRFETSNLLKQFSEGADSLRRISFGPVAAILILLALNAGFIPKLKEGNEVAMLCCFAFVAGFSERLVMKLVEKVGALPK